MLSINCDELFLLFPQPAAIVIVSMASLIANETDLGFKKDWESVFLNIQLGTDIAPWLPLDTSSYFFNSTFTLGL